MTVLDRLAAPFSARARLRVGLDLVERGKGAKGFHYLARAAVRGCTEAQYRVARCYLDGKAVPQYFVMLGGAATSEGATFARLAAKVPAHRLGTALERVLEWYGRERTIGETPRAFFGRAKVSDVKLLLADLEAFDAAAAAPEDYIDLGETRAFVPEVMEGECAT